LLHTKGVATRRNIHLLYNLLFLYQKALYNTITFLGVTGTSKPHVVRDYGLKLHNARWDMKEVIKGKDQQLLMTHK
jgi:hypothetical protein